MDHMLNYTMEMGEIPSSLSKMLKPLLFDEQPLPERLEGDCWLLSIFDNFSRKNQTIKGCMPQSLLYNSFSCFVFSGSKLHQYSKVVEKKKDVIVVKPLPICPSLRWTTSFIKNGPPPSSLFHDASKIVWVKSLELGKQQWK